MAIQNLDRNLGFYPNFDNVLCMEFKIDSYNDLIVKMFWKFNKYSSSKHTKQYHKPNK